MSEPVFSAKLREIGRSAISSQTSDPAASTRAARDIGLSSGIGPNEQFEIDRRELGQAEFSRKYGAEANRARNLAARSEGLDPVAIGLDRREKRTPGELANDLTLQVGGGLAQGIAGLGNLGILAAEHGTPREARLALELIGLDVEGASRDARRAVATAGDSFNQVLLAGEGDIIRNQTEVARQQSAARLADSELEFERSDKKLGDQLKRIGRDAIIKGQEFGDNPASFSKTTANAVGSLAPSFLAAGGTGAVVKGVLSKVGMKGTKTGAVLESLSSAGTIGALEGQGAYNQVVVEVNQMGFDELQANSQEFRDLVAAGADPSEAREAVADAAGIAAQKQQTAIASVAGLLVPRFEANPLGREYARTTLRQLGTLAGETAEEAVQSASGEFSANVGIREFADDTREVSEGVGEAFTEGAVGGFGATGVIQTPGAVRVTIEETSAALKQGADTVIKHRAEVARRKFDDQSTIGEKATSENITQFETTLRQVERLQELAAQAQNPDSPLNEQEANELLSAVDAMGNLPQDLTDTTSEDFVARTESFSDDVVEGSRTQTLRRVARKLTDEAYPDSQTTRAAAEFVQREFEALQAYAEDKVVAEEKTEAEQVTGDLAANIIQNKVFSTAYDKASEILNTSAAEGSSVTAVTPREMIINPVGVNPERVTDEAIVGMAPEVQPAALVVKAIQSPETGTPGSQTGEQERTRRTTRKELLFNSKRKRYGVVPSFNDMMSMLLRGAINQTRRGSTITADPQGNQVDSKDTFTRLRNLIQHQQNKFDAAVQSYEFSQENPGKDSAQVFDQLSEEDGETFRPGKGKIFVNAGSDNSVETFRQIAEDLNTGIRAYNALLAQFPEIYQGEAIPEVALPESVPERASAPASQDQAAQPGQDQQTETATDQEAAADPVVDSSDSSASDSLPVDRLSFADLFGSTGETTLAAALDYVEGLASATPGQKQLIKLIRGSSIFKSNPDFRVRQGTEQDIKPRPETRGWFDPQKQEIVLFDDRISVLMHEGIQAVTLEILNQNLTSGFNKNADQRNETEKAAIRLKEMADAFLNEEPTSERMRSVQAMMRQLVEDNDGSNAGTVQAINEFMAYGLTEGPIQRDLAAREYVRPGLAARILSAIRKLFGFAPDTTVFEQLFFDTHRIATDYQTVLAAAARQEQPVESRDVPEGSTPSEPAVQEETEPEGQAASETTPETTPEVEPEPVAAVADAPTGASDAESTPAPETVLEPEIVEPSPAPATPAADAAETTAAAETTPVSEPVAAPTPERLEVGLNLAEGLDGESLARKAHSFNPVMGYEETVSDKLNQFGETAPYNINPDQISEVTNLVALAERWIQGLQDQLQDRLDNQQYKKGMSFRKALLDSVAGNPPTSGRGDTVDVFQIQRGLTFNLLDNQSLQDGEPVYDEHLLRLAVLAAVDYIMNIENGGGLSDPKDVLEALGLDPENDKVDDWMYDVVNFGRNATDTKEGLAAHIRAFWGAKPNGSVTPSLSRGISEALADEILDYLSENESNDADFWIQRQETDVQTSEGPRTYTSFKLGSQGTSLGPAKTILQDALTEDLSDIHQVSLGRPFSALPETLQKDRNIPVPEDKRQAVKKQQDTPFFLSDTMFDIYKKLGLGAGTGIPTLAYILGYKDLSDGFYNGLHRKSIEGKNSSIQQEIERIAEVLDKIDAYAKKNGIEMRDVPIHYRWEITLNGRFQMQGFNPQGSKLAREIFTPTRSTIDLTAAGDMTLVWAAIGQAIDDFKIENIGLAESAARAQEYLARPEYERAREALRNMEDTDNQRILREFFGSKDVEASARLLKALVVANQIDDALAAGQQSLDIDLAMELDGKTNGPITAAIQNNTDEFSPQFLALVRRGGFFIGSRFDGKNPNEQKMSYAEFHRTQNDNADLYEVTGQVMSDALIDLTNKIKAGEDVAAKNKARNQEQALKATRLAVSLLKEFGDVSIERTENGPVLTVKRRGTKSPITQNLYGAGLNSIAAGLANDIFKAVYEEITDAVREKDGDKLKKMAGLIDALADIKIGRNREQELWAVELTFGNEQIPAKDKLTNALNGKLSNLEGFKFSQETFVRIRDALANTYLPAFEQALSETVGVSVKQNNDELVKITNAQTNVYLALVRDAIAKVTAEQRANGTIRPGQDISIKDYRAILNEYRQYAPVYDANASVFDVTGGTQETSQEVERRHKKSGEASFRSRSVTLSGKKSGSKRDALDGAGVKILPYNVIANADVAMINGVYNDERILLDTLAVHDGIEVPVGRLREMSLIMNEKVAESWQTNTFEPILETVRALGELNLESLVGHPLVEEADLDILLTAEATLQDMVDRRQAKIAALETVQYTVDGAPGAENPYIKSEGQRFDSEQKLINHLNRVFKAELTRIQNERLAENQRTLEDRVEQEPPGGSELRRALESVSSINGFIRILGEHLQTDGQRETYTQLVGSPALQEAIADGLGFELLPQDAEISSEGVYNALLSTMQIKNVTAETALHELVHAVTVGQLEAHYADPAQTNERASAVKRLESLMEDFVDRQYEDGTVEAHVKTQVQLAQRMDNPVAALNEFMAWSLTNEDLIRSGKRKITTDPLSQLRSLGKRVIEQMRRILGFRSNKVFDHILFNTAVILQSPGVNTHSEAVLRHQIHDGTADMTPESRRKLGLQHKIANQVTAFLSARNRGDTLQETTVKQQQAAAQMAQVEIDAYEALSRAEAAGYRIEGAQDHMLFRTLQSIFAVDFKTDKIARLEAQRIYSAIIERVGVEQMLNAMGYDIATAGPNRIEQAEAMLAVLRGVPFTDPQTSQVRAPELNADGLSNALGTFLALAQVAPEVRSILEDIDFGSLGLAADIDTTSLDSLLLTVADRTIGRLNERAIDDKTPRSTAAALDGLTEALLSYEAEGAFETETRLSITLGKINAKTKSFIEGRATAVSDRLEQTARSNDGLIGAAAAVGTNLADILIEDRARAQADTLTNALNNSGMPEAIRNLWAEIRGITADTAGVLRLVKAAKQQISVVRQEYVEKVPQILAKQFSDRFNNKRTGESNKQHRERVRKDWEHMFNAFGKTDIPTLIETLGVNTALSLFGNEQTIRENRNQQLREMRDRLKAALQKLELTDTQVNAITEAMYRKAQQLGNFQINGQAGINLLTSADAIAGLYNENGLSLNDADYTALQKALARRRNEAQAEAPGALRNMNEIVRAIDALATLHSLDSLSNETHARIRDLLRNERSAINYALTYMRDLRELENGKIDSQKAKINGYKGHMGNAARRKYSVIIANKTDAAKLREQGYVEVRDYQSIDGHFNPRMRGKAYFFSAHQKLATYNQGAMQTVSDTYFGVDPVTGLTAGPETTGDFITGDPAKLINRRLKGNQSLEARDQLIPRFSETGTLIGYERALAPDMIQRLEMSNNFAEALGKWSGRIAEENMAKGFNKALIDAMKDQYDQDPNKDAYAAFGRKQQPDGTWDVTEELQKDPVWRESYFLIPQDTRRYAEEVFGGPILVRRDQINNALGFRSASVADIWSGRGRMNDEVRQTVQDIFVATPFIGQDIYKYLTVAEEGWQQIVSEVKHVIVVKSGVVLAANTLSNVIQLAAREVPLSYMGKRTKSKFAELQQYKRNEEKKIQLRADAAGATSQSKRDALLRQVQAIEESEQRMSIAPLLNANQFTTISEGLTDADKAMMDGRFMDWVESKAAELPGALSTVARYAIISKDTALYQGMSRAVQYSDFIAKAVYYDFLTEERGATREEALLKIDQEFINYDLNDSRTRSYLESMGLTWFMNFKLRSLKIAMDLARNNPASTLLGLGVAGAFGLNVGSPVTDNVAGAAADGRLGYSIGPGMVEAGWNLNPWNQIFGR